MGWFSSSIVNPIAGSYEAAVGLLTEGTSAIEDELNDPRNQQILAAGAGFLAGGPAGGIAAQQSVASIQQSREAEKQAEQAAAARDVQRRQANVKAIRQRAQALRERRIAESQIQVEAGASGISASSAAAGASSGVVSQTVENLEIINANVQSQNEMFDIANRISSSETRMYQAGAYADIGKSVFTYMDRRGYGPRR